MAAAPAGAAAGGGIGRVVSFAEWEQLVQDFRMSSESRSKWLSQFASPAALLDQALQVVTSRKESQLKLQILAFIDENAHIFLDDRSSSLLLDALRSTLQLPTSAAESAASASNWLREQMMVTVTSAMICNHEAVPQQSLESLIEMLLSFVNRPNHSSDRHLRATACECLRELELAHPCLLHSSSGHLLALCQAERTHAGQSYTLLLTTILCNLSLGMQQVRSFYAENGSSYSILSTSIPLVPFSVPPFLNEVASSRYSGLLQRDFSDENIKELRRAVSFLLERPNLLTEFVLSEFISDLSDIAVRLELQPSLLRLQFWNLLQAYNPVACHALVTIFTKFPEAFDGEEIAIYKRLVLFCDEYAQPLTIRLLAMHWMLGMEEILVSRRKDPILPQVSGSLYPQVFDALSLKAAKLECLARCAAVLDKQQRSDDLQGGGSRLLNDGLVCLSAYKWLPPHSTETRLLFHALHRFLIAGDPHLKETEDSLLFRTLQETLVKTARNVRRLVCKILVLLDRFLSCKTHCNLGQRILRTFSEDLVPTLPPNLNLPAYFCLMERIAEDKKIPPSALIESLESYVKRRVSADSGNEAARLWLRGNEVLAICRVLLMHHQSSRIFHKLQALLAYICRQFPDIEVRDSARFYLRMLVSVPGKKLREILLFGDDRMEDSKPQLLHVSSLLSSPSPRAYKGAQQSVQVSSYIFLGRESPLLVRSSWSLVVHESFQPVLKTFPETFSEKLTKEGQDPVPDTATTGHPSNLPRMMDTRTAEVLNIVRNHFSEVPETGFKVQVLCRLRLKLEPREQQSEDHSSSIDGIYSVVVSFSTTGSYGPIPTVRVPFLLSSSTCCGLSSDVAAPSDRQIVVHQLDDSDRFSELVKLELEPKQPAPALVDCHIVFSDEEAQTVQGQLDSIAVGIEDLFMKPPVPSSAEKPTEYRYNLFNALWYACSGPGKLGSEIFLLKGGRQGLGIQGAESVKLLEAQADRIVSAVEKYLAEFVVAVSGATMVSMVADSSRFRDLHCIEGDAEVDARRSSGGQQKQNQELQLQLQHSHELVEAGVLREAAKGELGCFLLLIFLPPRYHLLLRMEVSEWSTLARIRTDYWPSLAHIDEFLESFLIPRTEF